MNERSRSTKVKLEAYVAQPPTKKCQEVIDAMEEVVRRHPEKARLVVCGRGAPWPEPPSAVLQLLVHKGARVPVCLVDGVLVAAGQIPTVEDLEARLVRALQEHRAGK